MNFYSISALLIVVINIHESIGISVWHGTQVSANDFNWVVKVETTIPVTVNGKTTTEISTCTGSIISELHIITAAHCSNDRPAADVTVTAGMSWASSACKSKRRVKTINIPTTYKKDSVSLAGPRGTSYTLELSDISVLTLETALTFGPNIAAIPLPAAQLSLNNLKCKMAGWGRDQSGQASANALWTTLEIGRFTQFKACQTRYQLICARDPYLASHPGDGDSGAGLMCDGALVGVLWGSGDAVEQPSMFQNIYKFGNFITQILTRDAALLAAARNLPKPAQSVCLETDL